jgi:hypothetical protein
MKSEIDYSKDVFQNSHCEILPCVLQFDWIKVSDKLPELPEKDGVAYLTYPHYRVLDFHDNNFYDYDPDFECEKLIKDVTHWMPLPDAPK